jgi:hypothetical protein
MGLATQMDRADAFRAVRILQVGFWSIFALLMVAAVLVFVLMRVANLCLTGSRWAKYCCTR